MNKVHYLNVDTIISDKGGQNGQFPAKVLPCETSMNLLYLSSSPPQTPPRCARPVQTGSVPGCFYAVTLPDGEIIQGIGGTLCKKIVPDKVKLAVPDSVPNIVPIIYPSAMLAMPNGHCHLPQMTIILTDEIKRVKSCIQSEDL